MNKGIKGKTNDLDTTPPAAVVDSWKSEIIQMFKEDLLTIDRPNMQFAMNQIMIERNLPKLKEMGILAESERFGEKEYKLTGGMANYMDSVTRLMTMVTENKPDAYMKTQSVFNSIGKNSGPEIQVALFMRMYDFIDNKDTLDDADKLDWKSGILEANYKLLFDNEELLREKLGNEVVDTAIGYFYKWSDQARDYAQSAYSDDKQNGEGAGGKKKSIRLPDLKIATLKERRKTDGGRSTGTRVSTYQDSPSQATRKNPNPGSVDDFKRPPNAISKNYFKTDKIKEIARKMTLVPTKQLKGLDKKK